MLMALFVEPWPVKVDDALLRPRLWNGDGAVVPSRNLDARSSLARLVKLSRMLRMPHTPPVPAANTSPFPRHEPPHEHSSLPPTIKKSPAKQGTSSAITSTWALSALAGIGAAALAATAYFVFAGDAKASGKQHSTAKKRSKK